MYSPHSQLFITINYTCLVCNTIYCHLNSFFGFIVKTTQRIKNVRLVDCRSQYSVVPGYIVCYQNLLTLVGISLRCLLILVVLRYVGYTDVCKCIDIPGITVHFDDKIISYTWSYIFETFFILGYNVIVPFVVYVKIDSKYTTNYSYHSHHEWKLLSIKTYTENGKLVINQWALKVFLTLSYRCCDSLILTLFYFFWLDVSISYSIVELHWYVSLLWFFAFKFKSIRRKFVLPSYFFKAWVI